MRYMACFDMHNHILFGIDDGASLEEISHSMVAEAAAQGITHLVCTPHFDHEYEQVKTDCMERLQVLQSQAPQSLTLLLGLEVYLTSKLPQLFDNERIWTLNNSRYMLIELPMRRFPEYTFDVLAELIKRGVTPIIAHPERNQQLREQPVLAQQLAELGCRFQLNSSSIVGRHGDGIQQIAQQFLKLGLYSCLGSDAHNESTRPIIMQEAKQVIDSDTFAYFMNQSEKIVRDEPIELCAYRAPIAKKQSLFAKLFKK